MTSFEALEAAIGHGFSDPALLVRALTHASYTNEHGGEHYERLEFLGDAILQFCVTVELYRRFPDAAEGELNDRRQQLVSERVLAPIAAAIGVGPLLRLGRGEEKGGGRGRDTILADAVEAIFGAVYLDAGLDAASGAVNRLFGERWQTVVAADANEVKSPKNALQELTARRFKLEPRYDPVREGPEHAASWRVNVILGEKLIGSGVGRNQRDAGEQAARAALAALEAEAT